MVAIEHPNLTSAFGPANTVVVADPANALAAPVQDPPIALLGVPFDHLTMEGALERIDRMVASRQPHYVVTANADFLAQARRDVELRRILLEAHLVLCDGTPLVWASRLLGNPLPERVAGADLVPSRIRGAAEKGDRIFFRGGAPGVAEQAAADLQAGSATRNLVGPMPP